MQSLKSLAFQEQDEVVSACATAALWSAFQKTAELFDVVAPTRARITQLATRYRRNTRPLPSSGLQIDQVCQAISEIGLEPDVLEIKSNYPLLSIIYGYLKFGIPIILVGKLKTGKSSTPVGLHAITLTGFLQKTSGHLETEAFPTEYKGIKIPRMKGLFISELYAHDDQIGPFARVYVEKNGLVDFNGETTTMPYILKIPYIDKNKQEKNNYLDPRFLIAPVYHKIRITPLEVIEWLHRMEEAFNPLLDLSAPMLWDVSLSTVNSLKKEIWRDRKNLRFAKKILTSEYPKYFWHIQAFDKDNFLLFEILADATDVKQAFFLRDFWFINEDLRNKFHKEVLEKREALTHILTERLMSLIENDLPGSI